MNPPLKVATKTVIHADTRISAEKTIWKSPISIGSGCPMETEYNVKKIRQPTMKATPAYAHDSRRYADNMNRFPAPIDFKIPIWRFFWLILI